MIRRASFTTVEMLIVTVVMLLIGGAVMVMSQTGPRVWTQTTTQLASITNGQRAMDRVLGDLRQASTTTVNCAPGGGNELTLTQMRDTNGDGVPDPVNVSYDQNGTVLARNGATVAGDVSGFRCTRFGDGRVAVEVTVRVDATRTRTLTSQVWVRQP